MNKKICFVLISLWIIIVSSVFISQMVFNHLHTAELNKQNLLRKYQYAKTVSDIGFLYINTGEVYPVILQASNPPGEDGKYGYLSISFSRSQADGGSLISVFNFYDKMSAEITIDLGNNSKPDEKSIYELYCSCLADKILSIKPRVDLLIIDFQNNELFAIEKGTDLFIGEYLIEVIVEDDRIKLIINYPEAKTAGYQTQKSLSYFAA